MEEEKQEIERESAELNQYKDHVGLDDETIRRCVENVANVDINSQDGLKLILSVVSRVCVFSDSIRIETLISTDGTDPDPTRPRTYREDFESTIHHTKTGRVTKKAQSFD